jgi:hypothetical protein
MPGRMTATASRGSMATPSPTAAKACTAL